MSREYIYISILASFIEGLIKQKRADGFIYEYEAYVLKTFDMFCVQKKVNEPIITRELVMEWSIQRKTEGINYRNQRVSFVRQLSIYMNSLGINSYIPHQTPSTTTSVPHILSEHELKSFYEIVDNYLPPKKWHRFSLEYQLIFRLFYCCGLRLSEACNLKVNDVNLEEGILKIIHSKGNKDRLVYMAEDVTELCRKYYKIMTSMHLLSKWFFPGQNISNPISKTSLDKKFKQFWNMTEFADSCDKVPTIHSLRHTFVVNRMNKWMSQKIDINTMMPYLSKYLGHSSVEDTFYYYHTVDSAFTIIRQNDVSSGKIIPEVMIYEE